MRIFIDENVPSELAPLFRVDGHTVVHVEDRGRKGTRNGDLLRLVAHEFDVFLTAEANPRVQRPLRDDDLAVASCCFGRARRSSSSSFLSRHSLSRRSRARPGTRSP